MASSGGRRKADLKVVILGVSDIGKTALISRYIEGKFSIPSEQTIGASFSLKQWGPHNVAIWDTAGGERFRGLSSFYCRGAGAAILAFDLSDWDSFDALSNRFLTLLESAESDCLNVVVGTKSDLLSSDNRTSQAMQNSTDTPKPSRVPAERGIVLARQLNKSRHFEEEVPYFETSSLSDVNVDEVFEYIFKTLLPLDQGVEVRKTRSSSLLDLGEKKTRQQPEEKKKCC